MLTQFNLHPQHLRGTEVIVTLLWKYYAIVDFPLSFFCLLQYLFFLCITKTKLLQTTKTFLPIGMTLRN